MSEAGFIEFFARRRDHRLQSFTIKIDADAGQTDGELEMLIVVVFDEIEEQIDLAIADSKVDAN